MTTENLTLNFLQNVQFRINVKRLPNASFFLQKMQLPDINITPANQPTPGTPIKRNGDVMTYSDLTLTFVCDEHLSSYVEIFNWMVGLTGAQTSESYDALNRSDEGLYSDISVTVLSNSKRPIAEFYFHKCFPTSITNVSLDTTVVDTMPTEMTVTFAYDTFEILGSR